MSDLNYYLFFAGLMLVASAIFAVVARFYKEHLPAVAGRSPSTRTIEPTLAAGTPSYFRLRSGGHDRRDVC